MLPTLETERLILRPFNPDDPGDVSDAYAYAVNPRVAKPAGFKPPEDIESERQFLAKMAAQDEAFALQHKHTGRIIGSVGVHNDSKQGTAPSKAIGYALNEDYWNQGLMTEAVRRVIRYAFESLPIDTLRVYHYKGNDTSRRVIEKCGFVYEGTLRHIDRRDDGTFEDDVCYSILREEYESSVSNGRDTVDSRF